MDNNFHSTLSKLKKEGNFRELKLPQGVDFSSNDYLGFSDHPKIKEALIKAISSNVPIGSGGSRLLTGNKKEHTELEEFAAQYFDCESCLFFSSGFLANYAIFTTLPDRHDFIIYDELSHASIRDGIKASNAKSAKFKHNEINSLKEKISYAQSLNAKSIWVAIESVYSMDGDIAPLEEILKLIKNNIYLIIDEAHATGIFGTEGKGFSYGLHSENIITLHTCSKALGVSGALICGGKYIIEYLVNKARPFIFTTAESPLIAVAVKEALILSQNEPQHREKLLKLIDYTHKNYVKLKDKTQIIPIILSDSQQALDIASLLQTHGFDVRAIRPPTVPSARLRISLNAKRTKEEIDRLFSLIKDLK